MILRNVIDLAFRYYNGIVINIFAVISFLILSWIIFFCNKELKSQDFISENLFVFFFIATKLLIPSRKHFNRRSVYRIEILHGIWFVQILDRTYFTLSLLKGSTSRSFGSSFVPPEYRGHATVTHGSILIEPPRAINRKSYAFFSISRFLHITLIQMKVTRFWRNTLTDADDERHGENRRENPRGRKHAGDRDVCEEDIRCTRDKQGKRPSPGHFGTSPRVLAGDRADGATR